MGISRSHHSELVDIRSVSIDPHSDHLLWHGGSEEVRELGRTHCSHHGCGTSRLARRQSERLRFDATSSIEVSNLRAILGGLHSFVDGLDSLGS